jgi:PKD repeat protein/pimeloyl-ACP methyl ester carboxylesterase
MKSLFLTTVFLGFFISVFALPDLVMLSGASFDPLSVNRGDAINFFFTVRNDGNSSAAASIIGVYISSDLTNDPNELVGIVSVKALNPGESTDIIYVYPIPIPTISGDYFPIFVLDGNNEINESDENNSYCFGTVNCESYHVKNTISFNHKIPYPILFVHGWTDNSGDCWNDFTAHVNKFNSWEYGGNMNFCLNPDNNVNTSDGYILDFTSLPDLNNADYYYVNFDVSNDGQYDPILNDYESNQSAIRKQGFAISFAISHVMAVTGKDKVILVGHSMGGLASREYIQNPVYWPADGKSHVAKLVTVGSPNGGSDYSLGWLDQWGQFIGKDTYSEAARDFRYPSSEYSGLFLFGGIENQSIDLHWNYDVDVDGDINDLIVGLNEKISPTDIAYSCIIGDDGSGSDKYVLVDRADLGNYIFSPIPLLNPHADKFTVGSEHSKIQKENPQQMIQSLDEPKTYDLSYEIPLNEIFFATISEQAANDPFPPPDNTIDYDDYKFTIPQSGNIEVIFTNIPVKNASCDILDDSFNYLKSVQTNGLSTVDFTLNLNPGTYYLEISGIPDYISFASQYCYGVFYTPTAAPVANFKASSLIGCNPMTATFNDDSAGTPTSWAWSFPGGTPTSSTQQNPTVTYNSAGQFNVTLKASNNSGSNTVTKTAFIKVGTKPTSNFTANTNGAVVTFTNTTTNADFNTNYSWNFGDNSTSNQISPIHTFLQIGNYTVTLTATNSCGNTTFQKSFNISVVETNELAEQSKSIEIMPNPNNGTFSIALNGKPSKEADIQVLNPLGQIVWQSKFDFSEGKLLTEIKIASVAKGLYFLKVGFGENRMQKVFVVD